VTDLHPARRLWNYLEPIHSVTYFAPGCTTAMADLGLKGFWMGYFASRGAPFGAVGPAVIEATFYNFAPGVVRRAIPDAWRFATNEAILTARAESAAAALRAAVPGIEQEAARIVPLLEPAVRAGRLDGRPIFAVNQALGRPADPVAALWQCATSLREHRGDGHVAALVATDVSGIEAHQLVVAGGRINDELLRSVRGWTTDEWVAAKDRLLGQGLIDDSGLTTLGRDLVDGLESVTDDLATQPYRDGLTEAGMDLLPTLLRPISRALTASGILPITSPTGVPSDAGHDGRILAGDRILSLSDPQESSP